MFCINTKYLFSDNIYNICNLTKYIFPCIFFQSISCVSIYIIVCLNKNIILTNKVIKHNRVKHPCSEVKYLDLYMSINFFIFIYIYH